MSAHQTKESKYHSHTQRRDEDKEKPRTLEKSKPNNLTEPENENEKQKTKETKEEQKESKRESNRKKDSTLSQLAAVLAKQKQQLEEQKKLVLGKVEKGKQAATPTPQQPQSPQQLQQPAQQTQQQGQQSPTGSGSVPQLLSKHGFAMKLDASKLDYTQIKTQVVTTLRANQRLRESEQSSKAAATASVEAAKKKKKDKQTAAPTEPPVPTDSPFYDPRLGADRIVRRKRTLQFLEPGTFTQVAQTDAKRQKLLVTQYRALAGSSTLAHLNDIAYPTSRVPLLLKEEKKTLLPPLDPIPDCEWWDEPFLLKSTATTATPTATTTATTAAPVPGATAAAPVVTASVTTPAAVSSPNSSAAVMSSTNQTEKTPLSNDPYLLPLNTERITNLIEHPVYIPPPAEPPPPPPQPLKLTAKERKRLRKQRRMQKLQEQRDRVLLGLEPPPKPKVRIANMMRVYGAEYVQDPTQIEALVKKEMKERMKRHEERNAARKLTPEQRREKKRKKLFENTSLMTRVAVFRVPYRALLHPKLRFKVDINAAQYYLSGVALLCEDKNSPEATFGLVCVEGGPKAIRRYKKLMLRRINWDLADDDAEPSSISTHSDTKPTHTSANATATSDDDDDSDENEASSEQSNATESRTRNKCFLVWEGDVLKPSFRQFRFESATSEQQARKYLQENGVPHYWDMAKAIVNAMATL
jgi:hypothetical protein